MRAIKSILSIATGILLAFSNADAKEFLVGSQIPLTGVAARVGTGTHEGILLAVEIFNRRHPQQKIKLLTIDDETSPAKAVTAVEKLASQGVVAFTGGFNTNVIGPASDAAHKAGLVYITSGSTTATLPARGYKTYFTLTNTISYTNAMVGLLSDMKIKSASLLYSTKEATADIAADINKALSSKNVKVVMHPFDAGITDFKPIVNKVKRQDRTEAILMVGYENDYVGIIRAAKVLKPNIKSMVGLWQLATSKMATEFPDLMPNVFGTSILPYPAEFKGAEGKDFAETYRAMFKKDPDYLVQFGYVQSMLLFEAIKRADDKGTLVKGGLADEMRKTNRDTLIGRVKFDEKGVNATFQQRMGQHQNGKIVIVWPKEFANGRMNFPRVPWE